jgi:hypothetical protein
MHFKKILIVVKTETVIMSMALQIPELFLWGLESIFFKNQFLFEAAHKLLGPF